MTLALCLLMAAEMTAGPDGAPPRQPQLAVSGGTVHLAYGAGNAVFAAASRDDGATWTKATRLPGDGVLSLGMRRGPRIAATGRTVLVTAVLGAKGKGADGDVRLWRSTDEGRTWAAAAHLNDAPDSAREGLHAMAAAPDGSVAVVWLDLRQKGMRLYGVFSRDAGKTWSANRLLYESPGGSICECCHPTVALGEKGRVVVMFRNSLAGNRDMYLLRSTDGGATFGAAEKLGQGTWELRACPMDGGSLLLGQDGVTTVWRRESSIYLAEAGKPEQLLGNGRQPVIIATRQGPLTAWTDGPVIRWRRAGETRALKASGSFLSLVETKSGKLLLAGEREGRLFMETAEF